MGDTFLESIEWCYGSKARNEALKLLATMDLPDPDYGEYLRGTEAIMLFLDRYGIVLRVGEAENAPEHDLILRPLHSVKLEGEGEPVSITILPGVEGVARTYDEVDTLSKRLAEDGINFWDDQQANCGYIRSSIPGFEKGVLVVVDRGAVSRSSSVSEFPAVKKTFDNAVLAGLQEKVFAPFVEALDDWPSENAAPDPDDAKSFLYRCVGDIHRGENPTLKHEWNRNDGDSNKPSRVAEMAKAYESRLKQRDHDRCLFYASLPLPDEIASPMNSARPAICQGAPAALPA